ncbi:MAG: hypothetical protein ACI8T1_000992 [Verrucomicrobiales bacterium]|jgi:hypothetical protein
MGSIAFYDEWALSELLLPLGPRLVSWYSGQASWGTPGRVLLDEVTVHRPMALAEALETSLPLTMGRDAPWVGMPAISARAGGDVVMKGLLYAGQEAWIDTTVVGPVKLDFSWRLGPVSGSLALKVDGATVVQFHSYSGSNRWDRKSAYIGSGEHAVRWYYGSLSFSSSQYGGNVIA